MTKYDLSNNPHREKSILLRWIFMKHCSLTERLWLKNIIQKIT